MKDVDSYIDSLPKEIQPKIRRLRAAIRQAAPKAKERISYGMPYYDYNGRLAYFRLAKSHIGLYLMTPTTEKFKKEIAGYETTKATIRLPLDEKLPISLIKRMVRFGVLRKKA